MRENSKLTSLLKYICITTSVSCAFVIPAKADFDASAFIAGILNYTGTDWDEDTQPWGDEMYYTYGRDGGNALKDDITNDEYEVETTIPLSAGEWRVKKNDYGTIYGTSACNSNSGSEWWLNGIVTKSNNETDSGGGNCWCKMTGLAGTDGTKHDVSVGAWFLV